ncbi:ATP-binding cassette domain-containing protein [Lactococcus petauri]|uniref:ATP-binding cassette domain-containing protein n=1 Tax=Lactococcus petauri TaxID=1940789 RepID=UPI003852B081
MTLKIEQICKNYRQGFFLKNVSLTFEKGKIYGVLGRNGSGKSTLFNIIGNRMLPSSGKIYANDDNHSDNLYPKTVYLMNGDNLFPNRIKLQKLFKIIEKFYGAFDWEIANKMMEDFEVSFSSYLGELSLGYQTIVKLIISLSVPCDYIFLDDPVLGLDVQHRNIFYEYLIESYQKKKCTFVITTHLIKEIENILEEVVVLEKGKVVCESSVEKLLENTYTLSGSKKYVEENLEQLQVIGKESLGGSLVAYVKGEIEDGSLPNISIRAVTLQEYFIQLINRKERNNEAL